MKGFKTIFLKEFKRVFSDTRMLFAMFVPGIVIFVIYSLMGTFMQNSIFNTTIKDYTYRIAYTDNYALDTTKEPGIILSFESSVLLDSESHNSLNKTKISYKELSFEGKTAKIEEIKKQVLENNFDAFIVFSDDFEDKVFIESDRLKNRIITYYNGANDKSNFANQTINSLIPLSYNNYLLNVGENSEIINGNLSTKDSTMTKIISFLLPMLTVSLLYSTVITIVPETIAGEKERRTLSLLLLTPTKRSNILLGKILNLSIASMVSGVVSCLGLLTSLPKLLGGMNSISLSFSFGEISLLFLIVLSTLILLVSFGTLVSCFAKTTKEANSYLGPLTVLFMAVAMVPILLNNFSTWLAFVPVINLSACMINLINTGSINLLFTILTFVSNIVFTTLLIYLTTRLFNKENIIVN